MDYNKKISIKITGTLKKNRFIKHCYNVIQKIFALNYCMLTNNYPANFLNLLQVLLQMHEYFTKIYYRQCFLQLPETFHMKLSGFLHWIFLANQKSLTRTCNSVFFFPRPFEAFVETDQEKILNEKTGNTKQLFLQ